MSEIPPELSQPDKPRRHFSASTAPQDEINARFSYIMDDVGLNHIESGFDSRPSVMERVSQFGNFLLGLMPN